DNDPGGARCLRAADDRQLDQCPTVLGCFEYGPEISSIISKDSHALLHRRCLVSVVCAIAVGGLIVAPMQTAPTHVIQTRDIQLIDSADSLLGDGAALVLGGRGL